MPSGPTLLVIANGHSEIGELRVELQRDALVVQVGELLRRPFVAPPGCADSGADLDPVILEATVFLRDLLSNRLVLWATVPSLSPASGYYRVGDPQGQQPPSGATRFVWSGPLAPSPQRESLTARPFRVSLVEILVILFIIGMLATIVNVSVVARVERRSREVPPSNPRLEPTTAATAVDGGPSGRRELHGGGGSSAAR